MIICDEAHFPNNIDPIIHHAVELLDATDKLFLTDTPMINRPIELIGLLEILWKDDGRDETLRLADYDERSHIIQHQDVSIDPKAMKANLAYLDPVRFKSFASSRQGKPMPPETAASVLPIVLSIVQLRRTIANAIDCGNDRKTRIDADIPPYDIHTVELTITST